MSVVGDCVSAYTGCLLVKRGRPPYLILRYMCFSFIDHMWRSAAHRSPPRVCDARQICRAQPSSPLSSSPPPTLPLLLLLCVRQRRVLYNLRFFRLQMPDPPSDSMSSSLRLATAVSVSSSSSFLCSTHWRDSSLLDCFQNK